MTLIDDKPVCRQILYCSTWLCCGQIICCLYFSKKLCKIVIFFSKIFYFLYKTDNNLNHIPGYENDDFWKFNFFNFLIQIKTERWQHEGTHLKKISDTFAVVTVGESIPNSSDIPFSIIFLILCQSKLKSIHLIKAKIILA